jgi:hypothetical protein
LTTADSAVKFLPEATKPVTGWKGLEYRAAFPMLKPPGANFYPPDMDKTVYRMGRSCIIENESFTSVKTHSFSLYRNLNCGRAV